MPTEERGGGEEPGEGQGWLSAMAAGPDFTQGLRGGLGDRIFGGISREELQGRDGERFEELEALGEKDVEQALDLVLGGDDLSGEGLAFPGQGAQAVMSRG